MDARTIRDQQTLTDIRFFATMVDRPAGDRLLRDWLRMIRDGQVQFGRPRRRISSATLVPPV